MSVINPNETAKSWRTHRREAVVHLYLSGAEGEKRGSHWLFSSKSPVPLVLDGPRFIGPVQVPPAPFSEGHTLRRIDPTYLPSSKFPSPLRAPTSGPATNDPPAESTSKAP